MDRCSVVVTGDDVYEDLFTGASALQQILIEQGFVATTSVGTAALAGAAEQDLVVLYTAMGAFPLEHQVALAAAVRGGTGLVAVHSTNVHPQAGADLVASLVGSRYTSHGPPPHESRFRVELAEHHPITRGLAPFAITHEHYAVELLVEGEIAAWRTTPAGREPIVHTHRFGAGRVCYLQLGHNMQAWGEPSVRELVGRAAAWAVR